jgi:hypothetical protein
MLPFTHEQFLEVFARYNLAVWPAQFFAYLLAAVMLGAIFLVGGSAAWMLNVPQDWLLLVSGATVLLIARTGRPRAGLQPQGRG